MQRVRRWWLCVMVACVSLCASQHEGAKEAVKQQEGVELFPGLPHDCSQIILSCSHFETLFALCRVSRTFRDYLTEDTIPKLLVVPYLSSRLVTSIQIEDTKLSQKLLALGADPNYMHAKGIRPLHYASEMGCQDGVQLLLEHKALANVQDEAGTTPLHVAGTRDCANLLLSEQSLRIVQAAMQEGKASEYSLPAVEAILLTTHNNQELTPLQQAQVALGRFIPFNSPIDTTLQSRDAFYDEWKKRKDVVDLLQERLRAHQHVVEQQQAGEQDEEG